MQTMKNVTLQAQASNSLLCDISLGWSIGLVFLTLGNHAVQNVEKELGNRQGIFGIADTFLLTLCKYMACFCGQLLGVIRLERMDLPNSPLDANSAFASTPE